ncbi:MAG: 30S ribosome-binding factor RbfA [Candidatus Gastranaerophilales bacterium]|nr:30S ribosome-binding factor RbfA [Candidatus Gastranaerophilales bacterium]
MSLRNERVRKTLQKEISDIILKEINNPKISGFVSITDVEVSHDNSYAKVFYSILAPEDKKEEISQIIMKNVPKIRYEVGKRVRLRLTPELNFIPDESLERGDRITNLIDKISKGEV